MPEEITPKQIVKYQPRGRRTVGRPWKRWNQLWDRNRLSPKPWRMIMMTTTMSLPMCCIQYFVKNNLVFYWCNLMLLLVVLTWTNGGDLVAETRTPNLQFYQSRVLYICNGFFYIKFKISPHYHTFIFYQYQFLYKSMYIIRQIWLVAWLVDNHLLSRDFERYEIIFMIVFSLI
jgi:hypothetical protein